MHREGTNLTPLATANFFGWVYDIMGNTDFRLETGTGMGMAWHLYGFSLAWIPGVTAQRLSQSSGGCLEFLSHRLGIWESIMSTVSRLISLRRLDECRLHILFIYAMYSSRDLSLRLNQIRQSSPFLRVVPSQMTAHPPVARLLTPRTSDIDCYQQPSRSTALYHGTAHVDRIGESPESGFHATRGSAHSNALVSHTEKKQP
ncbi:hypothetical protein K491DRAFT_520159 [Lophiostoma macrostomum CBS 122681]|uniref:Uncharacterized protein n=1 Tax=Lophiostoma macrostomum CBS 122681 TaxID=1314788 RepID=A0A6A6T446_9PLEO|nr:hypothetical protein K491DRAFT_520159 [Lophiostoma macrostomum CBS 122681]